MGSSVVNWLASQARHKLVAHCGRSLTRKVVPGRNNGGENVVLGHGLSFDFEDDFFEGFFVVDASSEGSGSAFALHSCDDARFVIPLKRFMEGSYRLKRVL